MEYNNILSIRTGELIGKIRDIMIDSSTGQIACAIISLSCPECDGGKYYAVPWDSLSHSKDDKVFYLNIPIDKVLNAPSYDRDKLPALPDKHFISSIYSYYGSSPYWR